MALTAKQELFIQEYLVDVDRFYSYVDTNGECWEWKGAKTKGYGVFHIGVTLIC